MIDDTNLPIGYVEIRLYQDVNNNDSLDIADIFIDSTFTHGATGIFCFDTLTPGEYVLSQVQPANFSSVSDRDHSINAGDPDGAPSLDDPDVKAL